jgi:WhiB family redox-sensing transcriptional regulator
MSAYPTRDDVTELPSFDFLAQPWAPSARCAETDPEAFHPAKGRSSRQAKAVCARCPVRHACLDWAMATDQRWGIWGALSTRERDRLKWAGKVAV